MYVLRTVQIDTIFREMLHPSYLYSKSNVDELQSIFQLLNTYFPREKYLET